MTPATIVIALIAGAASNGKNETYPLAAAMVIDGKVSIVDVPSRTIKPLPFDDLIPEEADLSQDRSHLAFDAQPKSGGPARIYLVDLATNGLTTFETVPGANQRFPRFIDGGSAIIFTGAEKAGPGGPENRGRLWRLALSDKSPKRVPTPDDQCAFSPVGLLKSRLAYISTSCFLDYQLATVDLARNARSVFGSVSDARAELAASPDGKTVVWTSSTRQGMTFYARGPDATNRTLVSVPVDRSRLQPRFVCPRDLLFVNLGKVWVIDTKQPKLSELMDLLHPQSNSPSGGVTPKGDAR
jgi:dipeptidyl aminopeptidase/acylaminoacyl peptidase